jgi:hypothetical protein
MLKFQSNSGRKSLDIVFNVMWTEFIGMSRQIENKAKEIKNLGITPNLSSKSVSITGFDKVNRDEVEKFVKSLLTLGCSYNELELEAALSEHYSVLPTMPRLG